MYVVNTRRRGYQDRKKRTGYGPLALLDHRLDGLDNTWVCLADLLRLCRSAYVKQIARLKGNGCDVQ